MPSSSFASKGGASKSRGKVTWLEITILFFVLQLLIRFELPSQTDYERAHHPRKEVTNKWWSFDCTAKCYPKRARQRQGLCRLRTRQNIFFFSSSSSSSITRSNPWYFRLPRIERSIHLILVDIIFSSLSVKICFFPFHRMSSKIFF